MCSMMRRSVSPRVASRMASTRTANACNAPPPLPRRVLQLLEGARADAARREVDDAKEACVVVRVLDQAQVGQRVLDLGALEEAQPAVDLVRHAGIEERALE